MGNDRRRIGLVSTSISLVVALAGCEAFGSAPHGAKPPPGAQIVHLIANRTMVRLDPPSVRAGDVYVQLDDPADGGMFSLVQAAPSADVSPGPLDDRALDRVAHGDTEFTSTESFGPSCTGNGPGIGVLVHEGTCGNVWKLTLGPGEYAILGPAWVPRTIEASLDPTTSPSGLVLPPTMAVLEVLP